MAITTAQQIFSLAWNPVRRPLLLIADRSNSLTVRFGRRRSCTRPRRPVAPQEADDLVVTSIGSSVPEPDLTSPHIRGRTQAASDPSSPEFVRMFRLIGTLTIEKITADTAISWISWTAKRRRMAPGSGPSGYSMCGSSPSLRPPSGQIASKRRPRSMVSPLLPTPPTARMSRIEACGSRGEVEVYPGVDHGFAIPGRATCHQAATRPRARLLDLFNRALAAH